MGKKEIVSKILDSYEEITITEEKEGIVFFELKGKEYGCWYPETDQDVSSPFILVKNDIEYDYPHILPTSVPLDKNLENKYRYVCLHENDSTIAFLQSLEEKLRDVIERLIHLLSLSNIEREEEFQKEFLFYWNDVADCSIIPQVYLAPYRKFQKINAYKTDDGKIRFVAYGVSLNDANKESDGWKKWKHIPELPVFYIPITDKRRVLPPTRDKKWTGEDIVKIICGKQFNRISHESYISIGQEKVKNKYVGLIFEMEINENYIDFTVIVGFKSTKNDTLLNKLKQEITEVMPIMSRRADYYHLCRQIGNENMLLNKKVLVVGAGSLGSYIARELVKAGIKTLTIYDSESLVEENLLRHTVDGFWVGYSKTAGLKYELEQIHPEIHVTAVGKDIDKNSIITEMEKADLILFTVGSSTVQWKLNKVLKNEKCKAKVVYAWLEAGGENSHILTIDYNKPGCFECLYTDEYGTLTNNKANYNSEEDLDNYKIRNGCGGTRVAYGNAVLLRTTAVLLEVVRDLFENPEAPNRLVDITQTSVQDKRNSFIERKCRCCGDEIHK